MGRIEEKERMFIVFVGVTYLPVKIPCSDVTCENNGNCEEDSSGHFHCNCLDGFSGDLCQHSESHLHSMTLCKEVSCVYIL